jgi:hypothetical protein
MLDRDEFHVSKRMSVFSDKRGKKRN